MDVDAKLQQTISIYQTGQLQQAEQICQQILKDFLRHANALHLLGVIAYKAEEYKIATDLISRAVAIDSGQSLFYINLGNILVGTGQIRRVGRSLSLSHSYST